MFASYRVISDDLKEDKQVIASGCAELFHGRQEMFFSALLNPNVSSNQIRQRRSGNGRKREAKANPRTTETEIPSKKPARKTSPARPCQSRVSPEWQQSRALPRRSFASSTNAPPGTRDQLPVKRGNSLCRGGKRCPTRPEVEEWRGKCWSFKKGFEMKMDDPPGFGCFWKLTSQAEAGSSNCQITSGKSFQSCKPAKITPALKREASACVYEESDACCTSVSPVVFGWSFGSKPSYLNIWPTPKKTLK